jgi:hypothetical protein
MCLCCGVVTPVACFLFLPIQSMLLLVMSIEIVIMILLESEFSEFLILLTSENSTTIFRL